MTQQQAAAQGATRPRELLGDPVDPGAERRSDTGINCGAGGAQVESDLRMGRLGASLQGTFAAGAWVCVCVWVVMLMDSGWSLRTAERRRPL